MSLRPCYSSVDYADASHLSARGPSKVRPDGRAERDFELSVPGESFDAEAQLLQLPGRLDQRSEVTFAKFVFFNPPSTTISSHLKKGIQPVPTVITE